MALRRFVFIGAPGVGKGTYASIIAPMLGIPFFSAGNLVRQTISACTPLSRELNLYVTKGELVPDSLILDIIESRIKDDDASEGWLLDGYPRTLNQANHLDTVIAPERVINITLDHQIAIRKLMGRRYCGKCRGNFNVCHITEEAYEMPAILPNFDKCSYMDDCPRKLLKRDDDTEEILSTRMEVHSRETDPLLAYYANTKRLVTVPVKRGVKDVEVLMKCMIAPNIDLNT